MFCNGHQLYEEREDGMLVCKGFVGVVRPLQPPAIFEIPLVEGSFMTHHSLDMKFIFTDKRLVLFALRDGEKFFRYPS